MFDALPGGYRRIRVGYFDAARGRSVEFEKRLSNLIETTREGRIIPAPISWIRTTGSGSRRVMFLIDHVTPDFQG